MYIDEDMLIKRPMTRLVKDLREDTLFAACRHSYCGSVREEIENLVAKDILNETQVLFIIPVIIILILI